MALGFLVLITALSISAVAIYYSVAGLVAIFAAAALPIMIMGGTLEIAKLVTAVWLHRYWKKAAWWLRTYLATAVFVLMLITSMGIFGFLSKAHIEQTSASQESVAQVERLTSEIARQNGIIDRAEETIEKLESSGTGADANIQAQIDKEQERIDKAFERIQPAIDQQNKIIDDARAADGNRTKPYEDQLASIQAEILRLETSAREYEDKIANLSADTSAVQPLLDQIKAIEEEIIRVTNQLQSTEKSQIRAGQAIIGVTSDGLFGGNTREALAKWVSAQRDRIEQIQGEISQLRKDATTTVDAERERLAGVVKDIRQTQIPALKDRELTMLGKIDEVRQTESPAIATARDEIQRLRKSAEDQVAQSQALIERLRSQLAQTDKAAEIDAQVQEQQTRIKNANDEIDKLTEEKYALEAEYRKLEAEVGPIKYIAEFIYGDTADKNMLEEAVRWVIITIIFVFDPLAVLLLIASQYTFEFHRKPEDDDGDRLRREYEQARAQRIIDNPGFNVDADKETSDENREKARTEATQDAEELRTGQDEESIPPETGDDPDVAETSQKERPINVTESNTTTDDDLGDVLSKDDIARSYASDNGMEQPEVQTDGGTPQEYVEEEALSTPVEKKDTESSDESNDLENWNNWVAAAEEAVVEEEQQLKVTKRTQEVTKQEDDPQWTEAKRLWKAENPNQNVKDWKHAYITGRIEQLPWAKYVEDKSIVQEESEKLIEGYKQNEEQNSDSVWQKIRKDKQ